jgi:hypothetical protein
MDTALNVKPPISERINLRVLVFAGIILFLLGWPVYTFVRESLTHGISSQAGVTNVELKALGFFEMDPFEASVKDVPKWYRDLDGKKVRLAGEVYAPYETSGRLSSFTLVYSIQKCCFNGPPKVQERVFATVAPGKSAEFSGDGYHEVVGTLHVTMKRDPASGQIVEVYHLDVDSMKPQT